MTPSGAAALLPGAGVLVHVGHDLFHQLIHLPLVNGVGGGGDVVQRIGIGHLLVAFVHNDLIERRQLGIPAGLQLKAVDLFAVGQLFHHLVQLPELPPGVEDIVFHPEEDVLAEAVLAVFLGLLEAGSVPLQVNADQALVLGTVLLYPRKAQRIIADVPLVVGFLGRLQRPGQVELQRLVQLGLGLFGGLCHGTVGLCLVRAGEGRPALPGQRLQQRILCKECIGGIGAGLRGLHRLFSAQPHRRPAASGRRGCPPPTCSTAARAASQAFSRASSSL